MILRGADQAGHYMEVNIQHHHHQIVNIKFVTFIMRILDYYVRLVLQF